MATVGLLLIGVLVLLGAPVWLGILTGSTMALLDWGYAPESIVSTMYHKIASFMLVAVPMFIFAGQLLAVSGVARPMINLLSKFMGHIPGGPAYAVIIACVIFAAMSSSGLAALAGFAPIAIPMLERTGYSRRFSIGLLMCASALGPLIPPSIYLIIFGHLTEQPVRELWLAAFLPGFMLAAFLAVTVLFHTRRGHYTPPPRATWRERWEALRLAWPALLVPVAVLLPIYRGWVSPTEASAVAVLCTLFLGFVVYRELTLRKVWEAAKETAHLSSMIFLIVASAFMLSTAFTYKRIPFKLTDFIEGAGFNWITLPVVMILLFLAMGTVLDPNAILMILGPLLLPVVEQLGIDPLAYSVMVALSVEIGVLTPPYGLVLFAGVGILKEDFNTITRSVLMFYPALILGQFIIIYFPQISTFLPNLID
jgi:C4-dicarboxylate transporter DctM subunit